MLLIPIIIHLLTKIKRKTKITAKIFLKDLLIFPFLFGTGIITEETVRSVIFRDVITVEVIPVFEVPEFLVIADCVMLDEGKTVVVVVISEEVSETAVVTLSGCSLSIVRLEYPAVNSKGI